MWKNNRFVALRDPKKGGMHIAAASKGLSQTALEEITDNCLELIAQDRMHPGVCMYSMETGGFMLAMAMKIAGNRIESRIHEIVRGIILAKEELNSFCQSLMTENALRDIFFPVTTDFDHPENWSVPSVKSELRTSKGAVIDQLNGLSALGLFHALKEVSKKNLKIQLVVDDGNELQTIALLACMNEVAGTQLFIMANGECTLKSPDVLILKQAPYQDMRQYRKMTLEQFVHMGSNVVDNQEIECEEDTDEQRIQELTDWCLDYITDNKISDCDIYDTLGRVYEAESYIYQRLKRKLRKELFKFDDVDYYGIRYMKLLFVLYKNSTSEQRVSPLEMETPPYDYCGMYLFLKKKSRNKRELRRLLVMLLETQMHEITGQFDARAIHEAVRNVMELL